MNAKKDGNRISVLLGALNTDGHTPILVQSTSNALNVNNGVSGTDYGTVNAERDANRIPILMAVSALDNVTPVEIYADINGNLLVRST